MAFDSLKRKLRKKNRNSSSQSSTIAQSTESSSILAADHSDSSSLSTTTTNRSVLSRKKKKKTKAQRQTEPVTNTNLFHLETPKIRSARSGRNSSTSLPNNDKTATSNSIATSHTDETKMSQALEIEKHMAAPESTTPGHSTSGFFDSIVKAAHNAASSLLDSSQRETDGEIKPYPPSLRPGRRDSRGSGEDPLSTNFVQHLDSLLGNSNGSNTNGRATTAKGSVYKFNNSQHQPIDEDYYTTDVSSSINNNPLSDVVFHPIRETPMSSMGKGDLRLEDLGFKEPEQTAIEPRPGVVRPLTEDSTSPIATLESSHAAKTTSFPILTPDGSRSRSVSHDQPGNEAPSTKPDILLTTTEDSQTPSRSRSPKLKRTVSAKNFLRNNKSSVSSNGDMHTARPQSQDLAIWNTESSIMSDILTDGVPSMKRQKEFHNLFPTIPQNETFIDDFSCALQKEILVHGKMYLSQRHICFNSNILGWTTNINIPLKEVVQIEKKNIAGLFPNAITVRSLHQRYAFASLLQRDSTFATILNVWRQVVREERGDVELNGDLKKAHSYEPSVDYNGVDDDGESTSDEEPGLATDDASTVLDLGTKDGDGDDDDDDDDDVYDVNKPDDDQVKSSTGAGGSTGVVPASGGSDDIPGPSKHKPTEFERDSVPGETKIVDRSVDCPVGKVFSLLFGNDATFLKGVLEKQKNHSVSDIPGFTKSDGRESRSYSYTKPLGGPVGPKETVCQVEEIIHHSDFTRFIEVQQKVQTPDVPSGSSFIINTFFYLTWDVKNSTKITIFTYVEWIGKSWIKGAIEKGALNGQKDSLNNLVDEVIDTLSSNSVSISAKEESKEPTSSLPLIGPKTHPPTTLPMKPKPSETQVLDDIIPAPLGTVYLLLFGDNETSLQTILTKQRNYKIGTISPFSEKERSYEYTKPINAPIGPKETRCLVKETIEAMDLKQYILVKQSTQTPDVPSGSSFVTVTSIYLSWAENNSTRITVLTEVQWSGKSWIKSVVEKNAVDGQKESMAVLSTELKDMISKSMTVGGKRPKKGKKGRSTTKSSDEIAVGQRRERSGFWGKLLGVADPALSMVGIDADAFTIWGFFTSIVLGWVLISWIWTKIFGSSSDLLQNFELNRINKIQINGEEFLVVPKVAKILTNEERKKEVEYEIWEWIEKRTGRKQQASDHAAFAESYEAQGLKLMIDLAERNLQTLKESL